MHEGKIESEEQQEMLAIPCNELITWNSDTNSPDLFYLCGQPRICGRVNHVKGRLLGSRKKKK
jgi:hypothetical protein